MKAEDFRWGCGTAAALCLCALFAPLIPVLALMGKWGGTNDRQ